MFGGLSTVSDGSDGVSNGNFMVVRKKQQNLFNKRSSVHTR